MQAPIAVIKRVMKHQTEGGDRRLCQGLCAQPGDRLRQALHQTGQVLRRRRNVVDDSLPPHHRTDIVLIGPVATFGVAGIPFDSWPNAIGLARCPSRHAGQETGVECLPGGAGDAER